MDAPTETILLITLAAPGAEVVTRQTADGYLTVIHFPQHHLDGETFHCKANHRLQHEHACGIVSIAAAEEVCHQPRTRDRESIVQRMLRGPGMGEVN